MESIEARAPTPYEDGRPFGCDETGPVGPYERIDLTVTYAIDPTHESNAGIVDLADAPRDDDGKVRYRGDAVVLRPIEPASGNRVALLDVPNRGFRRATALFNRAAPEAEPTARIQPGDGFLMDRGFTLAWVGWQWDVPRSEIRMGLDVPWVADTEPGWMQLRIQLPTTEATVPLTDQHVGPLGGHRPIPPADPADPEARLLVRDRLAGEPSPVPRDRWSFTDDSGQAALRVDGGLEAGRIYDLIYRVAERPVVGTGLLAARDLGAFLRSDRADNPIADRTDRLIITGVSQNSRLLRTLLHLGLDADEAGDPAFDGLLGVVGGGRRGEFNHRHAQPSVQPTPGFGHLFPFADEAQTDPRTGLRAGLLDRVGTHRRAPGQPPKIMFCDSSAEYWRGDASLAHTSVVDGTDVADAPVVRRYLFASTQHGAGPVAIETRTIQGTRGRNPLSLVDYRPLYRCALQNLVAWITDGTQPPPSEVPRHTEGTAATRAEVLDRLSSIPTFHRPEVDQLPVLRPLDLGPDADRGIGRYPARPHGEPYPTTVSAVDLDGNERAGIRMPDVEVPLATHTGFNPRHAEIGGEGQIIEYYGSTVPFPLTEGEREAAGDPRPSIAERYADLDDYLDQVRTAAECLVERHHLLAADIELCVDLARARWKVLHEAES